MPIPCTRTLISTINLVNIVKKDESDALFLHILWTKAESAFLFRRGPLSTNGEGVHVLGGHSLKRRQKSVSMTLHTHPLHRFHLQTSQNRDS